MIAWLHAALRLRSRLGLGLVLLSARRYLKLSRQFVGDGNIITASTTTSTPPHCTTINNIFDSLTADSGEKTILHMQ